jgi:drug/metabolite transporter (DMT)-like permease
MSFLVPALFVAFWSTGFIVARAAAPHSDLQFFLLARFTGSALVLGVVVLLTRSAWPRGAQFLANLAIGALMQGAYLTVSYWAVGAGIPAGIMALLGALQPLFTALWVVVIGSHRLPTRTWLGLIVGFSGVALVLAPKLGHAVPNAWPTAAVIGSLAAVLALTIGTLAQRRLPGQNLWSGACVQACGAALIALAATTLFGNQHWDNSPVLWASLLWVVLAVSVGGIMLLLWMMRHGEATRVTALFLLIPAVASLEAFLFFQEVLLPIQMAGFGLALGGVLMARSGPAGAV